MATTHRDEISRLELLHAAHPDGFVFPHLADAYRRAGRYAQAEDLLNAGLRKHTDYSNAHVVLGRLRLDQGKRDEAAFAFRHVLQLDPENQVALEALADLAAEDGRLAEAVDLYRRLRRAGADPGLASRIADLERRAAASPGAGGRDHRTAGRFGGENGGRAGMAGARGREAPIEAGPADEGPEEVVTETMAELYARQGLHSRAAAVYRRLLTRDPENDRLRAKLDQATAHATPQPAASGAPSASDADLGRETSGAEPPARRATDLAEAATPGSIRAALHDVLSWRADSSGEVVEAAPWPTDPAAVSDEAGDQAPPASAAQPPRAAPPGAPAETVAMEEEARAVVPLDGLIGLADMLVGLLEYRDPFFRGSSSLTRLLAASVARELGLTDAEQADLSLAAVLRDLGRLAMGGKLLPTPRVTPSPEGRRRIERHVDLALTLMEGIDLPEPVRRAVRHHHERWDGAGYPDALSGEAIPRLARILAVVDSFVAMVSPRPYRLPRKVPAAAAELQRESGAHYDPEVVNALVRVLANREQPNLGFVRRHHILLVTPDQPGGVVTAAKLCSAGYLAEVADDPGTARERLRRVPVAALVVSAEAGPDAAAAFIREIRADTLFSMLPIVVVEAPDVALRVRLLESGADVCFPPAVRHAELQGTLGALVRRTLAPHAGRGPMPGLAPEAPWLALQGDVKDFPLTWLLQVMKYDARTAAIGIRTSGRQGVVYLRNGDAVHARVRGGATGEEALGEMLQWRQGRFTVQPGARTSERTISTSLMHLLLNQAVHQDHAAAGIFGAVAADH